MKFFYNLYQELKILTGHGTPDKEYLQEQIRESAREIDGLQNRTHRLRARSEALFLGTNLSESYLSAAEQLDNARGDLMHEHHRLDTLKAKLRKAEQESKDGQGRVSVLENGLSFPEGEE